MNETYTDTTHGFSPEARAAYDAAASNLMARPETGVKERPTKRKDIHGNVLSSFSWVELLQLKKLYYEQPGVQHPSLDDDETGMVIAEFQVDPESEQEGDPSPNRQRPITVRMRYNYDAFERDPQKGQGAMTRMSIRLFRSLLIALGQDEDLGFDPGPQGFCADFANELIGEKLWATIRQAPDKNSEVRDEVARFETDEP